MSTYLGETSVDWRTTDAFKDYTTTRWALYMIEQYGQIQGDHHRKWVLDQVARILNGADVQVSIAQWRGGACEYRVMIGSSPGYIEWRRSMNDCEYPPYDAGIPP